MSVKLLAEHHLEETAQACLHLSKCHIVGNHMSWRKFFHLEKPGYIQWRSQNAEKVTHINGDYWNEQ